MSRSYRKPWVKDGYGSNTKRRSKRYHNRKLRRKLKNPNYEIADGNAHKNGHGIDRWDVCDYRWVINKPTGDRIIYWSWLGEPRVETFEEQMEVYRKVTRK